jgi:hypothetical protein
MRQRFFSMNRFLGALATLLIIPILYSCKADEVWNNANRSIEYSIFHISSVNATSTSTVRVTFSQDVEISSGENTANYSIPGLIITNASRDGSDHTVVNLTTSTHEDITYTLTVTNVMDTSGNIVGSPNSGKFAGDVAPMIKSVSSTGNTTIVVYFTEPVDQASAENSGNYITNPLLTISNPQRDATDLSKVTLTTSSQTDGQSYKLTINNIKDLTGNPLAAPNYEYFTGTGLIDTIKPIIISASLIDSNTVEVVFSEPMNTATTGVAGNYTIQDSHDNTIAVANATPQTDTARVWLDISGTFSEFIYIITVSTLVQDDDGNNLADPPQNKTSFTGQGQIPNSLDDGPVVVDPIDEGTNDFSLLVKYKGRIYLGPADADNAIFRMKPDGTSPEIVTFIFHGEPPLLDTNTLDPGPDAETGIDYIASGFIGGVEYLFFGPSKGGNLNYIYYTTDTGSQIDFDYIDLGSFSTGNTRGITSMAVFNNNFYIAFSDGTPFPGQKPILLKLLNIVQNPVSGVDVFNLQADNMPRIGDYGTPANGAVIVGIDVMKVYNNRLYIANGGDNAVDGDGGIIMTTTTNPGDYINFPGDWSDITPVADTEWYNAPANDRFSLELSSYNKLIPADRAFPAMAEFNGNLYIARNTIGISGGPQLWRYDGSTWSLVADNGLGITNMSVAGNTEITLLITNGDRLYIGFDNNGTGVQIFRTKSGVTDPSAESDFEMVSSAGLGDGFNNKRIFHGLSISDGGTDYLWILCGKTAGKLRLYRTSN